jgi:protein TonB
LTFTSTDLRFTRPAGFGLDEAALEAVRQWTYQPTMLGREPVAVETTINVNFSLQR